MLTVRIILIRFTDIDNHVCNHCGKCEYNVDNRIHGTYLMIEPCKLGEYSKIRTMEY
jgi:hypothetical protein